MEKAIPKYPRTLAIAPSTRGFGFVVMEGLKELVDWGEKRVKRDKNAGCLGKTEELIVHYEPDVIVLENVSTDQFLRCKRVRTLLQSISQLAKSRGVAVLSFSRDQIAKAIVDDGEGTKYSVAEVIAQKYPDQLRFRLPSRRRPWQSKDPRMDIFDAVALALMVR